jgi:uracil-DNA glycosylase family 4
VSDGLIWGAEPRPATLAIIADTPAPDQDRRGGPPGEKTLWPFLRMHAGVERHEAWLGTLFKRELTEAEKKKGVEDDELASWGAVLDSQLEVVGASVLLPLGKYAASHLLGRRARMETIHGLAFQRNDHVVVPAFHPAAGLTDSKRLAYTVDDFQALGRVLRGQQKVWSLAAGVPITGVWQAEDIADLGRFPRVAIDTEYDPKTGTPIMLTFSTVSNTGAAIWAHDIRGLIAFRQALERHRPEVLLHNALADLLPLKRMGVDLVKMGLKITDTMVLAWYQETEPQGLKSLAYRHLGVDRPGFEEIVVPYYARALAEYLEAYVALTMPELIPQVSKKTGRPIKPKLAPAGREHKLAKRFLSDHAKGVIDDYEGRWEGWESSSHDEFARVVGAAPVLSLSLVPSAEAVEYACADTSDTLALASAPALQPYSAALCDLDHSKIPMVSAMQERGLLVDLAARDLLLAELEASLAEREEVLKILSERPDFNPNSGDDIAEVLYGFAKIAPGVYEFMKDQEYLVPPATTKKGKPKTDKKALGTLRDDHELPAHLLEYKEIQKLVNTYVRPLPKYLVAEKEGWVLHPNIMMTRVPSGRLAMRRPNLMAIPSRTALGLRVRHLFMARPGYVLMSFDHSQIELRLAAEIAQDAVMLELFHAGVDLHTGTAAKITGRAVADAFWKAVEGKLLRGLFKKINFGVLYGATAQRVYLELLADGIRTFSLADCERMVREWFTLYEGIAARVRHVEAFIQQNGYAEGPFSGRRRKLPGAQLWGKFWPMSCLREEAVRQGYNLEIQESAQWFLIRAMRGFWEEDLTTMAAAGYNVFPLLQIHDELIFEVPDQEEAIEMMKTLGLARMTADQGLVGVPIESSVSVGRRWSDLK